MNLAESIRAGPPIPRNVPSIQIAHVRAEVGADINRVRGFGVDIGTIRRDHHP
jgi:hypothetical protein